MRRCASAGLSRWLAPLAAGLCLGFVACTDVTTPLIAALADSGSGVRPPLDSGTDDGGDAAASLPCGDHACACDDGLDNDLDTTSDGLDAECTGPFDDDERTFGTGRDDEVAQACQDCFWDENTDARDDGCAYPRSCSETGEVSAEDALLCDSCTVSQRCESQCEQRTPNGCDCFGCCTVTRTNGSMVHVLMQGSLCSLANIEDEVACKRCMPNLACRKECGPCELCLGRRRRDIAKSCKGKVTDPDQTPVCEDNETPCSETEPCDSRYYCHQGCCLIRVL